MVDAFQTLYFVVDHLYELLLVGVLYIEFFLIDLGCEYFSVVLPRNLVDLFWLVLVSCLQWKSRHDQRLGGSGRFRGSP